MAVSRLVYVHGCWVALEAEDRERLEKAEALLEAMDAEALLYDGVPVAPDCERVAAEAQERIRPLGVRVAAAWPNPRC